MKDDYSFGLILYILNCKQKVSPSKNQWPFMLKESSAGLVAFGEALFEQRITGAR